MSTTIVIDLSTYERLQSESNELHRRKIVAKVSHQKWLATNPDAKEKLKACKQRCMDKKKKAKEAAEQLAVAA